VKGIVSIFFVLTFFCSPVMGEVIKVTHTVKQTFGGGQSPDDARIAAMAKAKREALEKAGTYIESLTVVKNSQLEKDEILALAAGVLRSEVVSRKNFASEDAFGIEIVVNVVVDTSVLEERVKKQLQDRTHLTQLKDTQKREEELLLKVSELEEKNKQLMANNQSTEKISKEFQQTSRGLTAVDWLNKAYALWDGEKITNPKKAIEYLGNAIKLKPDYAHAYISRGITYNKLGQRQRAIDDYNEAVRLKPDDARAYGFRGGAYLLQGNNKRGCLDAQKACALGNCEMLEMAKGEGLCR
jgi:tetratricopeptide (TPR) repeat protein